MVVSFEGFAAGNWLLIAVSPTLHLVASLLVRLPDTCINANPLVKAQSLVLHSVMQLCLSAELCVPNEALQGPFQIMAYMMQTLANLANEGCDAVVPLVLATGLGAAVWAARLWWNSAISQYEILQDAHSQPEP